MIVYGRYTNQIWWLNLFVYDLLCIFINCLNCVNIRRKHPIEASFSVYWSHRVIWKDVHFIHFKTLCTINMVEFFRVTNCKESCKTMHSKSWVRDQKWKQKQCVIVSKWIGFHGRDKLFLSTKKTNTVNANKGHESVTPPWGRFSAPVDFSSNNGIPFPSTVW